MNIQKPDVVQVMGELESRGFSRRGGSPFNPPRIKGEKPRPRHAALKGVPKEVYEAFMPPTGPHEVDQSPVADQGSRADGFFAEVNIRPFLEFIASDGFDRQSVGKITKSKGWDAAAWYCPIHFFGFDWGIYVRVASVYEIAVDILHTYSESRASDLIDMSKTQKPKVDVSAAMSDKDRASYKHAMMVGAAMSFRPYLEWLDNADEFLVRQCIRAAYSVLYFHETFHHLVESLGTKIECISDRPLYVSYVDSVYGPSKGTPVLIEESLANAFAFRELGKMSFDSGGHKQRHQQLQIKDICIQYLRDRFPQDPPGYNRALEFVSDADFSKGLGLLIAQIKQTNAKPIGLPSTQPVLEGELSHLLAADAMRCVEISEPVGCRVLSDTPFHFDNRGKKLQKLLDRCGFSLIRQGEHEVWKKDGTRPIPVPRTLKIADGTAESILKSIDPAYRVRNFDTIFSTF